VCMSYEGTELKSGSCSTELFLKAGNYEVSCRCPAAQGPVVAVWRLRVDNGKLGSELGELQGAEDVLLEVLEVNQSPLWPFLSFLYGCVALVALYGLVRQLGCRTTYALSATQISAHAFLLLSCLLHVAPLMMFFVGIGLVAPPVAEGPEQDEVIRINFARVAIACLVPHALDFAVACMSTAIWSWFMTIPTKEALEKKTARASTAKSVNSWVEDGSTPRASTPPSDFSTKKPEPAQPDFRWVRPAHTMI